MQDSDLMVPPQNLEAEQAVLGSCLLDREALNNVMEYVREGDFYKESHRILFSCFCRLLNEGHPCDLVTVVDDLRNRGELDRVGGASYVASLALVVPSASSAVFYAGIVAEKAMVRSLIEAAGKITTEGYTGNYEPNALMEMAERTIFNIAERKLHQGFYAIGEVAVDVIEQIGNIKANEGVTGIPTYRDLDKLLSGLQNSDLVILAARPGMGKTSMALNIAQNAAVKHGKTVAVFSLEMPKEQLTLRMLCSLSQVNQSKVRAGMASKEDFSRLAEAGQALSNAELYLDDSAGITVMEMRTKCRKLKMEKKKLDLVVIDYLQLMQGGRRVESRQQEIAEISRSLKALAKELNVPVLALSQLSRLVERSNDPPNLSHLRESGALEQDADVVLFLHPNKNEEEESGLVDVIVAKHRNGPVGKAKLVFIAAYASFADYATSWVGEPPPED